ncbi:hypothetical protein, partial [Leptolyngbya sp. FACHB-711]
MNALALIVLQKPGNGKVSGTTRSFLPSDVYQLVAGFALWVNLSGSLYLLQLSSTQAKVTQAFLA